MKSPGTGVASLVALSHSRNERLLVALKEIAGRSRANTIVSNPPRMGVPLADTPFEIDGQEHAASLINLSLGRGKLVTDYKPVIGSLIRIGRITARVVAHSPDGVVAVDFVDIED